MSNLKKTEPKIILTSTDPCGDTVCLTDNTWAHIASGHPEVKKAGISRIGKTISRPFLIQQNDRDAVIYVDQTSVNYYFNIITHQNEALGIKLVTTAH